MNGKVVFISGGGRGLGLHIATRSRESGGIAFCASRGGLIPESLREYEDDTVGACELDVTQYESCEMAIQECMAQFGKIDVLINNASGYFGGKEIGQYSAEELRKEIETTLLGSIFLTNAFMAFASNSEVRQHIVFVSSISGLGRNSGNGLSCVYAAAKAGVIRFAETINETTQRTITSSHVLVPNNIRTEKFVSQSAVSQEDVWSAIEYLVQANDNLYVDQLLLNPFQRA